jgi:nitrilase
VDFDLGVQYVHNSLKIDSPQMKRICDCAAANKIAISLGFSERDDDSVYIAQVLIDDQGDIKMRRRKMKPTHMERTVFGDASGDSLASVIDLPGVGKVGALSCWEHIQPLLKYYTFSQHEQIHIAGWPPLDPFVEGSPEFWSMSSEGMSIFEVFKHNTLIIPPLGALNLSRTYAIESQSFVLHTAAVLTQAGIDLMKVKRGPIMGQPLRGNSAVIGPDGRLLTTAKSSGEELIIADLNLADTTKAKLFADASGHCKHLSYFQIAQQTKELTVAIQIAVRTCYGSEQTRPAKQSSECRNLPPNWQLPLGNSNHATKVYS